MRATLFMIVMSVATPALAEDIVGAWETPFQDLSDGAKYQLRRDFSADGGMRQVLQVEIHHPLLPVPYVTIIEEENTYVVGEVLPGPEHATALTETLVEAYETVMTQAWVDERNGGAFCGFTNWALGVKKRITGRDCNGTTHSTGDVHHNIFRIDGESINFGIKPWHDVAIGSTLELRPTELGPSIGYERITTDQ